jgi:hypothetical protein
VLSINNKEFAVEILARTDNFLQVYQNDDFLKNVLSLFEIVGEYAQEIETRLIIADFQKRSLLKYSQTPRKAAFHPVRAQVISVCAILAKHAHLFPEEMVDEIKK